MWLGLALRFGKYLLIPILLGITYAYAHHAGALSEQPKIDSLVAQGNAREAAIAAERKQWEARMADLTSGLKTEADKERADLVAKLDSANASERNALKRLSDARAARPALQPAASAPEPCRQFEASPQLLPELDRELLIRLGAAADRVVLERNAAVEAYDALVKRFLEEQVF